MNFSQVHVSDSQKLKNLKELARTIMEYVICKQEPFDLSRNIFIIQDIAFH